MSSLNYSLEKGEPKRLSLIWVGSNLSVKFDDQEVAEVSATKNALLKGHQIILPDDSTLSIQLVRRFLFTQLHINRNGEPVPNSPSDPHRKIRNASIATFILGGLHILVGIGLYSFANSMIYTALLGIMFVILGFAIRRESFWALLIAVIAQFLFNTFPSLINMNTIFATGGFLSIVSFFFRLYLLIQMMIGLGAMWSIRDNVNKSKDL
jgi:hypothetical protein